jgi:hypothetical protein
MSITRNPCFERRLSPIPAAQWLPSERLESAKSGQRNDLLEATLALLKRAFVQLPDEDHNNECKDRQN